MKINSNLALVDTSAWVEFFRVRGSQEIRKKVIELMRKNDAAYCEIVRLELWNGVRGPVEAKAVEQMESNTILLSITPQVWQLANQFAQKARQKGYTFPATDLLIAACARFHGATVLHRDRHFEAIAKIL